ncbi:hypothetical protein OO18_18540 [Raoultella ornithinolytica]|nr:hypothetical protein OO18_18540 [Raoultella ornithinolytica]PQH20076.1 hypothetical protein C5T93_23185 [Raoultella ornithinolytica]
MERGSAGASLYFSQLWGVSLFVFPTARGDIAGCVRGERDFCAAKRETLCLDSGRHIAGRAMLSVVGYSFYFYKGISSHK